MENKYRVVYGDSGLYVLDTAAWRTFRPVIDYSKCVNCGTCLLYCPVCAVKKTDGKINIDLSYCKGCGICRTECPKKAIDWVKEEK